MRGSRSAASCGHGPHGNDTQRQTATAAAAAGGGRGGPAIEDEKRSLQRRRRGKLRRRKARALPLGPLAGPLHLPSSVSVSLDGLYSRYVVMVMVRGATPAPAGALLCRLRATSCLRPSYGLQARCTSAVCAELALSASRRPLLRLDDPSRRRSLARSTAAAPARRCFRSGPGALAPIQPALLLHNPRSPPLATRCRAQRRCQQYCSAASSPP